MENLQHKDLLKARRIKYGLYCDFVLIGRHCEHYLIKLRSRFSLCWNSLLMYSMTSNRNCWVNHSMLIRPANKYPSIPISSLIKGDEYYPVIRPWYCPLFGGNSDWKPLCMLMNFSYILHVHRLNSYNTTTTRMGV